MHEGITMQQLYHEDTNENLIFHSVLSLNFFSGEIQQRKGILYPK